ncbi:MAG: nucleotide sugar dehydrogenase [bacterium]|nr:nucleotide sugar dehydrogenase [bacterium]
MSVSQPITTATDYVKPFIAGSAKLGIIGQGYVGLPLAEAFAASGVHVLGFDVDTRKIEDVNRGVSYIGDVTTPNLARVVKSGHLEATADFSRLVECEAVSICVPTPVEGKQPDLSYIDAAVASIVANPRAGQLIILESTTYPGTTTEHVLPKLEAGGRKVGTDFFLTFSPERVDPGNPKYNVKNTYKIVGGVTPECTRRAVELYSHGLDHVMEVSSPTAAEMVKLLENSFRAINIGFINEFALNCRALDVDVWEVIEAAKTKPFGFMPFYPGPGIGGHCIPIDPLYLLWKLKSMGEDARFIGLADEVNCNMPHYTVRQIEAQLAADGKALKGSKVLMLGVAYKQDIDDMRESPALHVADLLVEAGAQVSYHDPHVPECDIARVKQTSVDLTSEALSGADVAVIATAHNNVDYNFVVQHAQCIFDAKNVLRRNAVQYQRGKVKRI